MSTSYPDQDLLLSPSLQEWLSEGHLVYFIGDAVNALALWTFHARYAVDGRRRQPYDPSMIVKALIYAYTSGMFSSRKIAGACNKTLHFVYWLRAIGPRTARCASFDVCMWPNTRRCVHKWCSMRARRA